ncbi:MAG: branched-chain amino acid ABC transporter permease, partial [Chloroflexi bacterium]|nr:branched-chain amino acid ABC transporter permease [Chloroflexota bacterium]
MLPAGTFNTTYANDMAIIRTRLQWTLFIAFMIFLFGIFPGAVDDSVLTLANNIAIVLIAVLGLNILTGLCGQISIGQAAFMGVGAYLHGVMVTKLGLNFLIAMPLAALGTALIGLLFGIPSLRVKGFYLAMATLAAQFIITWSIVHSPRQITGGADGLHVAVASLGALKFDDEKSFFYLAFPIAALMIFFAKNIARTRVGRAFIAIRDND